MAKSPDPSAGDAGKEDAPSVEQALLDSEARYRMLVERLPVGVVVHTRGTVVYANAAFVRLMGAASAADLVGRPVLDFVHPDFHDAVRRRVREIVEEAREAEPLIERLVGLDGRVVEAEVTALPTVFGGEPSSLAMVRDVTQRRRAEEEARRQGDRLRVLHEIDRAILEDRPAADTVRGALDRAKALLGFDRANVIVFDEEKSLARILVDVEPLGDELADAGEAGREIPLAAFRLEGLRSGRPHRVDDVRRMADPSARDQVIGSTGVASYVSLPMLYQGDLIGLLNLGRARPGAPAEEVVAVAREVADLLALTLVQAAHRNATAAAERRYRGLFDGMPIGLFQSTPAGELLTVNRALVEMLGFSDATTLLARGAPATWADPAERVAFSAAIEARGVVRDFVARLRRADGETVWARLSARAVRDERGRTLHYEGSCEDVTRQTRLEEQLRQSQKMEAVGRLAGGIAHDFHNLLTALRGHAELLLEESTDDLVVDSAREIAAAVERASALTRQLLAFSRRQRLRLETLDLNEVVRGMSALLRRLIGEDVRLRLMLSRAPLVVRADRHQIEQVVLNLAVNARDAMPDGGRISIRTRPARLRRAAAEALELAPGRYASLSVRDSGSGIEEDVIGSIFEPFFTTKEPGEGTGLGLATAYGIVRQSGGGIRVVSRPGKGTLFRVLLPRAAGRPRRAPPAPGRAARPVQALGGTETVLLVEDDVGVRRLVERALRRLGYELIVAATPEEALLRGRDAGGIDLLLTDVVMPGMPGPRLADRLREDNPGLRVLFTSGHPEDVLPRFGLDPAIQPFLQKPFGTHELARALRGALARGDDAESAAS